MLQNHFCVQPRWRNRNRINSFTKNNLKYIKQQVLRHWTSSEEGYWLPILGNMKWVPQLTKPTTLRRFLGGGGGRKNPGQHRLVFRETELETGGTQRCWSSPKERPTRQANSGYAQLLPQVFRTAETHKYVWRNCTLVAKDPSEKIRESSTCHGHEVGNSARS